jgi:hypothetical protein
MRFYLGIAILFLTLVWDIGENNGRLIHGTVRLANSLLRSVGIH